MSARASIDVPEGLRVLRLVLVTNNGEIEEFSFTSSHTILYGPPNSSKTTTLKIIHYVLGSTKGPQHRVGSSIAEKYAEFRLTVRIRGNIHEIVRRLEHGSIGRVEVDGSLLSPEEFSTWALSRLDWPVLTIPMAQNVQMASKLIPLTFRALLRHVHRNEESWTSFANKEEEYLRRAVTTYFLGLAPERYNNVEYAIVEADRQLIARRIVAAQARETADAAAGAVLRQLGLPPAEGAEDLDQARQHLLAALAEIEGARRDITERGAEAGAATAAGHDSNLGEQYKAVAEAETRAAQAVAGLESVLEEHRHSLAEAVLDQDRLDRLISAVDVFDETPVRVCPACAQTVSRRARQESGECYVCSQPVSPDQRKRRAQIEKRALASEILDLNDAISDALVDLENESSRLSHLGQKRAELAGRLNNERASVLAPFVAALEELAARQARVEVQLASLPAVRAIYKEVEVAVAAVEDAEAVLDDLLQQARDLPDPRREIADRCTVFAGRMNEFLRNFSGNGWGHDYVVLNGDDMTFFVGSRPWDQQLGAEARVLFFFAYSYAILYLQLDLGDRACPPGLLLLDNPYQHGLPDARVEVALRLLFDAALETRTQVVSTQAKPVRGAMKAAHVIRMPREYLK
ncbi:hypothetical protein [Motilibacter deserti]|uniref:AAA domain-containing protein n=1 Tax=Motilibacter deserti TaxID=2714956 RepID=A0ABX0GS35_9ACTN|nr:hypothetical protein [Motilibacter deserti]NHC12571.1 hypothetical protein [Motilibacter deserti]